MKYATRLCAALVLLALITPTWGADSAAGPKPGTKQASDALAFDPFNPSGGGSKTAGNSFVVAGARQVAAPAVSVQQTSPEPPSDRPVVAVSDSSVQEPDSPGETTVMTFVVTLTRPPGYDGTVRVSYSTRRGTAQPGRDYREVGGILVFRPGETEKTIQVPVYGDNLVEGEEYFFLYLHSARPRNVVIGRREATGTIIDSDPAP